MERTFGFCSSAPLSNGKVRIAHKDGHGVAWAIVSNRLKVTGGLPDFLRTGHLKDIPDEVTLR